jgi:putative addiction module CopG family antidote
MTIHLPEDLERYVQSEVQSGHFASEQDAIAEAVRLLRQRKQQIAGEAVPITEEQLEQQLMHAGLLGSIPSRPSATTVQREFQPVSIEGEPLSETVIRERR